VSKKSNIKHLRTDICFEKKD
jgi:hypothetical protein